MKIVILRNGCKIKIEDAIAEELFSKDKHHIHFLNGYVILNKDNAQLQQAIALEELIAIIPDESYIVKECDSCKR